MRKRSAAGSSPNASPGSTAMSKRSSSALGELRAGLRAPRAARRLEVGVEVEGGGGRAALDAGGDDLARGRPS